MLNMIALQGRLVDTPELKQTNGGKYVTRFTIANSTKSAQGEEHTDFIDCVAWTKTAEFVAKYFEKGKEILITGRLSTRTYENNSGQKVKVTEVMVNTVDFSLSGAKKEPETKTAEETDVQLPFSLI